MTNSFSSLKQDKLAVESFKKYDTLYDTPNVIRCTTTYKREINAPCEQVWNDNLDVHQSYVLKIMRYSSKNQTQRMNVDMAM